MLGCGHCEHFYEYPSKETSVWAQLLADPELQKTVDMQIIEFGMLKPLPKEYSFVNYGPYFFLQAPHTTVGGLEMQGVNRDFKSMKKWILSNVQKVMMVPKKRGIPRNAPNNITY